MSSSTVVDGIGIGSSLLIMKITRKELGAIFTCKVNNIALREPLTVDIKLDVHGKYTLSPLHTHTHARARARARTHARTHARTLSLSLFLFLSLSVTYLVENLWVLSIC